PSYSAYPPHSLSFPFTSSATTQISTLSLHDALPIFHGWDATPLDGDAPLHCDIRSDNLCLRDGRAIIFDWSHGRVGNPEFDVALDRKSTRLNSSHVSISYAVFCLKKKNTHIQLSS